MVLNRGVRWGVGLVLIAAMVLVLAWAYRLGQRGRQAESELDRPLQTPLRAETQKGETLITLDASDLAATPIEVSSLEKVTRPAVVTAYGRVLDLTPLLDLQSRFAVALAQEEEARTALGTARREYERFKNLHDQGGIVSQKQVEDAQAAVRTSEAGVRSSETSRRASRSRSTAIVKAHRCRCSSPAESTGARSTDRWRRRSWVSSTWAARTGATTTASNAPPRSWSGGDHDPGHGVEPPFREVPGLG